MMVKICGITNEADAVASAQAGASALGFNFYSRSPRYIRPEAAANIGVGLRLLRVGVFVNESPATIEAVARIARLDIAQLHGTEASGMFPDMPVWKAFRVTPEWEPGILDEYPTAEAFLLDGPVPGSGEHFDWSRAKGLGRRIILAGGLDPDNVMEAIRQVEPWGVDACSRLESSPGVKDHQKILRFTQAARMVAI
jgi:phosphoribosylanthranilate isomerase